MPELIEYRQLPARSYPGFDRLSDRFVHYLNDARHVELSPALAHVLFQASLAKRTLVLGTTENAVLSPFVVREMRRFGHRWAYQRSDGVTCDAMSGQEITRWNTMTEPSPDGLGSSLPVALEGQSYAAVNIEVVGHHRPREDLMLGAMAEALATCQGGANLDAMGMHEPLLGWWSRSHVTEHAKAQMPQAELVRASSPDGAFVGLRYERSDQGVIERMNGRLVLGPWDTWASEALPIAEQLMSQFTKLCTPVVMTSSVIDVEPDGGQGIRQRHREQPLVWLAGPSTLQDARVDAEAISSRFKATTVGGRSRPSLMVSFPSNSGDPREQLNRLLVAVGQHGADQIMGDQMTGDQMTGDTPDEHPLADGEVRAWRPRLVE